MEYKTGMLCKHFKGENLLEKNIYRIEQIGVEGKDINETLITYTRDGEFLTAKNLVVYSNIFQENKLFAREYADISSSLTLNEQILYNQSLIQPLTLDEIKIINNPEFRTQKTKLTSTKYK